MHSDELRRCLIAGDVSGARRLWAHVAPHLPQPQNDQQAEVALHHARTQARSVPLRLRAYSHRWLIERSYPSGLPDMLRPRAERMYPRVVEAVGIACGATSELMRAVGPHVQRAMSDVVMDIYADTPSPDPCLVRTRMEDARRATMKTLLGRLVPHTVLG